MIQSNILTYNDKIRVIEVPNQVLTRIRLQCSTLGVPVIMHQVYVKPHNFPKGVCSSQSIVLVSGSYPRIEQSK
jgi:hypothetical protein